jgi:hypothetical protein
MAEGKFLGLGKDTWTGIQGMGEGFAGRGNQWREQQERAKLYDERRQSLRQERDSELSKERKIAMLQDAYQLNQLLEGGYIPQAEALLQDRLKNISALKGVPKHTLQALQQLKSGDIDGLKANTRAIVDAGAAAGLLKIPGAGGSEWTNVKVGSDGRQYGIDKANPSVGLQLIPGQEGLSFGDPEGSARFSPKTDILPDGSVIMSNDRGDVMLKLVDGTVLHGDDAKAHARKAQEYGAEIQGLRANERETGKGQGGRLNEVIDLGVSSARQLPTLRRTRSLLDELNTGGFAGAATRIRNALGIAGADETELTTNMARSVLGQLKEIFGAQFTEREGDRLARIENGIGKSTEGNKRIIENLIEMAEFKTSRAIEAAKSTGDYFAIREMESYMNKEIGEGGAVDEFEALWGPE